MNTFYNKHYIIIDAQNRITDAWSDGPHYSRGTTGAICINDHGGYQFRLFPDGEENPPLYTFDGIPRYKLVDGKPVLRSDYEIAADRAARPEPEPSASEDMMGLLVDQEYRLTLLELGVTNETEV